MRPCKPFYGLLTSEKAKHETECRVSSCLHKFFKNAHRQMERGTLECSPCSGLGNRWGPTLTCHHIPHLTTEIMDPECVITSTNSEGTWGCPFPSILYTGKCGTAGVDGPRRGSVAVPMPSSSVTHRPYPYRAVLVACTWLGSFPLTKTK